MRNPGKSLTSAVYIPTNSAPRLLADALAHDSILDGRPPYFANILAATDGIRFIFDSQGNYLEEVNSWQIAKACSTPSHHTRRARSQAIKPILKWYEDNDLDWHTCNELAHMLIMRLHFRAAGKKAPLLSKTGWNYRLGHWRRFLEYGLRKGWVDEIGFTFDDGRESGKSEPYIRALLPDEFRELIANAPTLRLRAGMKCIVGTGIRVSELAFLRVRDVPHPDDYRGRAYLDRSIVGKGQKKRMIAWPLSAAKSVLQYRKSRALCSPEQSAQPNSPWRD